MVKPAGGTQNSGDEAPIAKPQKVSQPEQSSTFDANTLKSYVQESVLIFADSVNEKSMAKLHTHMEGVVSLEELDKAFAPFYKAGIDLSVLKDYRPILDKEPEITPQNEMILEGHYPTTPAVVYFRNIYVKDKGKVKLIGININVK